MAYGNLKRESGSHLAAAQNYSNVTISKQDDQTIASEFGSHSVPFGLELKSTKPIK